MKRRLVSILLVLCMLLSLLPETALAAEEKPTSGQCGDNVYWSFDEGTGTLTISGTGEMEDWDWDYGSPWYGREVKQAVINDGVTSIGDIAFMDCSNLTSVVIPDSVTSIGVQAFMDCSSLTSVVIPDNVTAIGGDVFSGCSSLTSVVIPDSVTYIGENAFSGCSSLTSVVIPDSVTYISMRTFSGCSSLTSVVIPDSVTSIWYNAFEGCSSLTDVYYSGSEEQWNHIDIRYRYDDYDGNNPLHNATIHFNSTGPGEGGIGDIGVSQEKFEEEYIEEHKNYFRTAYASDIVPMAMTSGLGFLLADAEDDMSNKLYKDLSISVAFADTIEGFLNPFAFVDVSLADAKKITLKIPDIALLDLGSSEYSVLLYQLMASDTVYQGILDSFSISYQKNLRSFAKSISDNVIKLSKNATDPDFLEAKAKLVEAARTIQNADPDSVEFSVAYEIFERLGDQFLDSNKTKKYLENLSSNATDAFSFMGSVLDEINSIGRAYQYLCWAESYAETKAEFKTVLKGIAAQADERVRSISVLDKFEYRDELMNPYSEVSMCHGLSNAINSYLKTMDQYAEDAHRSFVNEVINKTGKSCVKLVGSFIGSKATKALGGSICPELAALNAALKSGKLIVDLFTNIDQEQKMLLSVESLEIIARMLKEVSEDYGNALILPPVVSPLGQVPEPLEFAKVFDESIKMYKNALLLACDYGIEYEKSKLAYAAKKAGSVPDFWYDMGATTPWQKQVSESSLAINLLSFQKAQVADIHCHDDGHPYNSSDGQVEYRQSLKVTSVACPVGVTVIAPDGTQLAHLTNDSAEIAPGYESYFFTVPLDEMASDYVKVAIIPELSDYQILLNGTEDGKMSVFTGRYDGENITDVETYANFPITDSTSGHLTSGTEADPLGSLVLDDQVYGNEENIGFVVTLDLGGGTLTGPTTLTTNASGTLDYLPTPTRDGYTFDCWSTAPEGSLGLVVEPNNIIFTEDTTIYACWTKISKGTYKVTLDPSGGTLTGQTTLTTNAAGTLSSLPTPTRSGYTFLGWYTAPEGGTKITTSTVFTKDTTLYAHYQSSDSSSSFRFVFDFDHMKLDNLSGTMTFSIQVFMNGIFLLDIPVTLHLR